MELAVVSKRLNDRNCPDWARGLAMVVASLTLLAALSGALFDPTQSGRVPRALLLGAVGLWLIVDNGFLPGTRGPNRHGPDPAAWSRILVAQPIQYAAGSAAVLGPWRRAILAALVPLLLVGIMLGLAPIFGCTDLAVRTVGRLIIPEQAVLSADRRANQRAYHTQRAGVAAQQAGDHAAAIRLFSHAIALYGPDRPVAAESYRARAASLRTTGELAAARADYDKAIELEPDHMRAYRSRAQILSALGRDADALDDYETALRILVRSHLGRGDALVKLGRQQEALEAYDEAARLAMDGDLAPPWLWRDEVMLARLRVDRDELVALIRMRRGNVYRALGRRDEALAEYTDALRVAEPLERLRQPRVVAREARSSRARRRRLPQSRRPEAPRRLVDAGSRPDPIARLFSGRRELRAPLSQRASGPACRQAISGGRHA
jgi:hypothetical protein